MRVGGLGVWVSVSGASMHMIGDRSMIYDCFAATPVKLSIVHGVLTKYPTDWCRKVDATLHSEQGVPITLVGVILSLVWATT